MLMVMGIYKCYDVISLIDVEGFIWIEDVLNLVVDDI